jgi:hypothetical protein
VGINEVDSALQNWNANEPTGAALWIGGDLHYHRPTVCCRSPKRIC